MSCLRRRRRGGSVFRASEDDRFLAVGQRQLGKLRIAVAFHRQHSALGRHGELDALFLVNRLIDDKHVVFDARRRRGLCGGDCGDGGMLCLYAFAFPRHCFDIAFLRHAVFFGERQPARFLHISAKRGKTMAGGRCDVKLHCRANTALHWLFSLGDS